MNALALLLVSCFSKCGEAEPKLETTANKNSQENQESTTTDQYVAISMTEWKRYGIGGVE